MELETLLIKLVADSGLVAHNRIQHRASVGYRIMNKAGANVGVMEIRDGEVEFIDWRDLQDQPHDISVSLCEPGSMEAIVEFLTGW